MPTNAKLWARPGEYPSEQGVIPALKELGGEWAGDQRTIRAIEQCSSFHRRPCMASEGPFHSRQGELFFLKKGGALKLLSKSCLDITFKEYVLKG